MSTWKTKTLDSKAILDAVLPEYKRISEAPSFSDCEHYLANERERRYKSTDSRGNIYLVYNPAAWREEVTLAGQVVKIRPPAELVMTAEEAGSEARVKTKKLAPQLSESTGSLMIDI